MHGLGYKFVGAAAAGGRRSGGAPASSRGRFTARGTDPVVVRISNSVLTNGRVDLYIALEVDVTVRIFNPMCSSMARPSVDWSGARQVTASLFRLAEKPGLTRHMNVSDKEGTPP